MAKTTGSASPSVTGSWNSTQTPQAGDRLVAVVTVFGSTTAALGAAPSGWFQDLTITASSREQVAYYSKVAAGSDAAPSFTSTTTGTASHSGIFCELYDLYDSSGQTPALDTSGTATGTTGTVAPVTGGNVTGTGEFAIAACGYGYSSSAAYSFTTPSGWTAAPSDAATAYCHAASFYLASPTSGATLTASMAHGTSSYVAGAVAVYLPPYPALSTLSDPFTQASVNGTLWGTYTAGSATLSFSSAGGTVNYPSASTSATDGSVYSQSSYSLAYSSCYAQIRAVPSAATAADGILSIGPNSNNLLRWVIEGGTLFAQYFVAGATTTVTSVTYSAVTHRWWRIRESGGTCYWDTSADGITWTNQGSAADPIDVTNAGMTFEGSCYENETNPGSFTFSNFNVPAVSPGAGLASATGASGQPGTSIVVGLSSAASATGTAGSVTISHIYYVSPSGSDANNGLSSGAAWQTVAKVNAATLHPGDTVLFQGGQTFSGTMLQPPSSGTAASPITFGSYGTGNATITTSASTAIYAYEVGGIVIENLTITGPGATASRTGGYVGVYFNRDVSGQAAAITVSNCTISGWSHGILAACSIAGGGYNGITLAGNTVTANLNDGINVVGSSPGSYTDHTNVTITNCIAHGNIGDSTNTSTSSGHGIVVGNLTGGSISNCTAYGNGGSCGCEGAGPVGIWCYTTKNFTIEYNVSYQNLTQSTSGNSYAYADGDGFDLDDQCNNVTLQYNIAYENYGSGIACYSDDTTWTGNTIRYNLTWGNSAFNPNEAELFITGVNTPTNGSFANSNIYGNTFICQNTGAVEPTAVELYAIGTFTGVNLWNNIIYCGGSGATLVYGDTAYTGIAFQGNLYYSASSFVISWGAPTYASLALWQATGQEKLSGANVGMQANPLLAAPGTAPAVTSPSSLSAATGLIPSPSSPVIGAGLNLSSDFSVSPGTADFFGVTLPASLPIGAAATITGSVASATGTSDAPAADVIPPAGLAHATGTAQQPSVNGSGTASAELATATGVAYTVTVSVTGGVSAGLAAGTGASLAPKTSVAANAGLVAGTGTAQQPSAAEADQTSAGLATGTGTSQGPAIAVRANAVLASGTGTAQQPSVTAPGSATAGFAAGMATAQAPVANVTAATGLAAGVSATQAPGTPIGTIAALAAGTAGSGAATPAITLPAGLATAAGAALPSTVITPGSATVAAGPATAAGSGQGPQIAVGASDVTGPATGTGSAQQPAALPGDIALAGLAGAAGAAQAPLANAGVPAQVAAATGTAQVPSGSPVPHAGQAGATGYAQQPGIAVATGSGVPGAAGSALPPAVATLGLDNSTAATAAATGTAQSPAVTVVNPYTADASLASADGLAQPPVAGITVPTGLASASGTSGQPVTGTGPVAATATGGAQAKTAQAALAADAFLAAGSGAGIEPRPPVALASAGLAAGTGTSGSIQQAVTVLGGMPSGDGSAGQPKILVAVRCRAGNRHGRISASFSQCIRVIQRHASNGIRAYDAAVGIRLFRGQCRKLQ